MYLASCLLFYSREKIATEYTAKDAETGVDNYHYLSQDPQGGVTGVARGMAYNGWEYSGSVCWMDQKDRTAITEVLGPDSYTWNQKRMTAAEVILQNQG